MFSPPLLQESSQAIMCPSLEVTFRSGGNSPTSRRHRACGPGQCRDPPLLPSCAGPSAGRAWKYVSKYMWPRVHTESSIRSHLHLYWAKHKLILMPPALTHHHMGHSRLLPCLSVTSQANSEKPGFTSHTTASVAHFHCADARFSEWITLRETLE